jgi:hypothetical protein
MKKIVIISTFIFISAITAFSQVENVAKEVLNCLKRTPPEF